MQINSANNYSFLVSKIKHQQSNAEDGTNQPTFNINFQDSNNKSANIYRANSNASSILLNSEKDTPHKAAQKESLPMRVAEEHPMSTKKNLFLDKQEAQAAQASQFVRADELYDLPEAPTVQGGDSVKFYQEYFGSTEQEAVEIVNLYKKSSDINHNGEGRELSSLENKQLFEVHKRIDDIMSLGSKRNTDRLNLG